MSDKDPTKSCEIYSFLMRRLVEKGTKLDLHNQKNNHNLTALDLSAEKCLPEIMQAIMQTNGVYRFLQKHCGIYDYVLYDVTSYEDWTRNTIHILHRITNVSEAELERFASSKVLTTEPFLTWEKSLSENNMVKFMFTYSIIECIFFVVNLQSFFRFGLCILPVSIILLLQCVVALTSEFSNTWRQRHLIRIHWKRFRAGKRPVVITSFQRVYHCIFALALMTILIMDMAGWMCYYQEYCFNMFIIAAVSLIGSFIYFFQLHATLSHYVVIMQEMIVDGLSILCMAVIILLIVDVIFYLVTFPFPCDVHIQLTNSSNSTFTSVVYNMYKTIYETSFLSYGLMAPKDIYFSNTSSPGLAQAGYLIMVMVITLVLMNLMIGVFSDHISDLNKHRELINTLQNISIALYNEESKHFSSIQIAIKKLLPKMHDKLYGRKHFLVDESNGKIYICVFERANK